MIKTAAIPSGMIQNTEAFWSRTRLIPKTTNRDFYIQD
jgi:hypothetical protein